MIDRDTRQIYVHPDAPDTTPVHELLHAVFAAAGALEEAPGEEAYVREQAEIIVKMVQRATQHRPNVSYDANKGAATVVGAAAVAPATSVARARLVATSGPVAIGLALAAGHAFVEGFAAAQLQPKVEGARLQRRFRPDVPFLTASESAMLTQYRTQLETWALIAGAYPEARQLLADIANVSNSLNVNTQPTTVVVAPVGTGPLMPSTGYSPGVKVQK